MLQLTIIYTVSSNVFDVTRDEANAAYNDFLAKIPPGDKEAHELTFRPIVEYYEQCKASRSGRQESTKLIVARMHQAKDQFTALVMSNSLAYHTSI